MPEITREDSSISSAEPKEVLTTEAENEQKNKIRESVVKALDETFPKELINDYLMKYPPTERQERQDKLRTDFAELAATLKSAAEAGDLNLENKQVTEAVICDFLNSKRLTSLVKIIKGEVAGMVDDNFIHEAEEVGLSEVSLSGESYGGDIDSSKTKNEKINSKEDFFRIANVSPDKVYVDANGKKNMKVIGYEDGKVHIAFLPVGTKIDEEGVHVINLDSDWESSSSSDEKMEVSDFLDMMKGYSEMSDANLDSRKKEIESEHVLEKIDSLEVNNLEKEKGEILSLKDLTELFGVAGSIHKNEDGTKKLEIINYLYEENGNKWEIQVKESESDEEKKISPDQLQDLIADKYDKIDFIPEVEAGGISAEDFVAEFGKSGEFIFKSDLGGLKSFVIEKDKFSKQSSQHKARILYTGEEEGKYVSVKELKQMISNGMYQKEENPEKLSDAENVEMKKESSNEIQENQEIQTETTPENKELKKEGTHYQEWMDKTADFKGDDKDSVETTDTKKEITEEQENDTETENLKLQEAKRSLEGLEGIDAQILQKELLQLNEVRNGLLLDRDKTNEEKRDKFQEVEASLRKYREALEKLGETSNVFELEKREALKNKTEDKFSQVDTAVLQDELLQLNEIRNGLLLDKDRNNAEKKDQFQEVEASLRKYRQELEGRGESINISELEKKKVAEPENKPLNFDEIVGGEEKKESPEIKSEKKGEKGLEKGSQAEMNGKFQAWKNAQINFEQKGNKLTIVKRNLAKMGIAFGEDAEAMKELRDAKKAMEEAENDFKGAHSDFIETRAQSRKTALEHGKIKGKEKIEWMRKYMFSDEVDFEKTNEAGEKIVEKISLMQDLNNKMLELNQARKEVLNEREKGIAEKLFENYNKLSKKKKAIIGVALVASLGAAGAALGGAALGTALGAGASSGTMKLARMVVGGKLSQMAFRDVSVRSESTRENRKEKIEKKTVKKYFEGGKMDMVSMVQKKMNLQRNDNIKAMAAAGITGFVAGGGIKALDIHFDLSHIDTVDSGKTIPENHAGETSAATAESAERLGSTPEKVDNVTPGVRDLETTTPELGKTGFAGTKAFEELQKKFSVEEHDKFIKEHGGKSPQSEAAWLKLIEDEREEYLAKARLEIAPTVFKERGLTGTKAYEAFQKDYGQEAHDKFIEKHGGGDDKEALWNRRMRRAEGRYALEAEAELKTATAAGIANKTGIKFDPNAQHNEISSEGGKITGINGEKVPEESLTEKQQEDLKFARKVSDMNDPEKVVREGISSSDADNYIEEAKKQLDADAEVSEKLLKSAEVLAKKMNIELGPKTVIEQTHGIPTSITGIDGHKHMIPLNLLTEEQRAIIDSENKLRAIENEGLVEGDPVYHGEITDGTTPEDSVETPVILTTEELSDKLKELKINEKDSAWRALSKMTLKELEEFPKTKAEAVLAWKTHSLNLPPEAKAMLGFVDIREAERMGGMAGIILNEIDKNAISDPGRVTLESALKGDFTPEKIKPSFQEFKKSIEEGNVALESKDANPEDIVMEPKPIILDEGDEEFIREGEDQPSKMKTSNTKETEQIVPKGGNKIGEKTPETSDGLETDEKISDTTKSENGEEESITEKTIAEKLEDQLSDDEIKKIILDTKGEDFLAQIKKATEVVSEEGAESAKENAFYAEHSDALILADKINEEVGFKDGNVADSLFTYMGKGHAVTEKELKALAMLLKHVEKYK